MAKTNEHDKASNRPFGGRIRRYAKVTSTMGGLAARVAGERYLGWNIDREKHAADEEIAPHSRRPKQFSASAPPRAVFDVRFAAGVLGGYSDLQQCAPVVQMIFASSQRNEKKNRQKINRTLQHLRNSFNVCET